MSRITKSLWNLITNTIGGNGVPGANDLIGFAPQPGTALLTPIKNCTPAQLIAGGGGALDIGLRFVKVPLNNAQVLALPTTPVDLVAGSVAGMTKFLVPLWASLRFDNHGDVTGIDDPGAVLFITGPSGEALAQFDEDTANGMNDVTSLLAAGVNTVQSTASMGAATSKPVPGVLRPNVDTPGGSPVNSPIQILAVNTLNFTGGNALNTLTVYLTYQIITL